MRPEHTRHAAPLEVPYGYCECGCGAKAPLARQSHTAKGYVKGEPVRFIAGHQGHAAKRREPAERFWEKVARREADQCWEWTAARTPHGYGVMTLPPDDASSRYRQVYAHRFSWELHYGAIPEGSGYHRACVLHSCDNPPCVNPAHLFVGTHAENMGDMATKGRGSGVLGERHRSARLTAEQVREIRALLAKGEPQSELARHFGVNAGTINNIATGRTWRHLLPPDERPPAYPRARSSTPGARGSAHRSAKLTEAQVRHARRAYTGARGEIAAFAKRYGVTIATMSGAIAGRTWRHLP